MFKELRAGHPEMRHLASVRAVDEVRDDVVHRHSLELVHADSLHVGLFAGLELADFGI